MSMSISNCQSRFEHPGLVKLPEISPKMQNANENYSDNRRTWVNTTEGIRIPGVSANGAAILMQ